MIDGLKSLFISILLFTGFGIGQRVCTSYAKGSSMQVLRDERFHVAHVSRNMLSLNSMIRPSNPIHSHSRFVAILQDLIDLVWINISPKLSDRFGSLEEFIGCSVS